jgi:hypothetical protein
MKHLRYRRSPYTLVPGRHCVVGVVLVLKSPSGWPSSDNSMEHCVPSTIHTRESRFNGIRHVSQAHLGTSIVPWQLSRASESNGAYQGAGAPMLGSGFGDLIGCTSDDRSVDTPNLMERGMHSNTFTTEPITRIDSPNNLTARSSHLSFGASNPSKGEEPPLWQTLIRSRIQKLTFEAERAGSRFSVTNHHVDHR